MIKFITSPDLCAHLTVWYELNQSVVNHVIDEWRRRLSACVDAEGGNFEHYFYYDCYSQNNNVKIKTL